MQVWQRARVTCGRYLLSVNTNGDDFQFYDFPRLYSWLDCGQKKILETRPLLPCFLRRGWMPGLGLF